LNAAKPIQHTVYTKYEMVSFERHTNPPFLGQACFSEGRFLVFLTHFPSHAPIFCLFLLFLADLFFGSPSLALIQSEQALQFLVAHFVGSVNESTRLLLAFLMDACSLSLSVPRVAFFLRRMRPE
jgi:hypothetical protein